MVLGIVDLQHLKMHNSYLYTPEVILLGSSVIHFPPEYKETRIVILKMRVNNNLSIATTPVSMKTLEH